MIIRRFRGLDVSEHPSSDAPVDTLTVQENADGFIDGAFYPRLGTKQVDAVWTGAIGIASSIDTGLRKYATAVRFLGPISHVANTGLPLAAED